MCTARNFVGGRGGYWSSTTLQAVVLVFSSRQQPPLLWRHSSVSMPEEIAEVSSGIGDEY
jgi:hypothetical protein